MRFRERVIERLEQGVLSFKGSLLTQKWLGNEEATFGAMVLLTEGGENVWWKKVTKRV
jgi:hypothetical protein